MDRRHGGKGGGGMGGLLGDQPGLVDVVRQAAVPGGTGDAKVHAAIGGVLHLQCPVHTPLEFVEQVRQAVATLRDVQVAVAKALRCDVECRADDIPDRCRVGYVLAVITGIEPATTDTSVTVGGFTVAQRAGGDAFVKHGVESLRYTAGAFVAGCRPGGADGRGIAVVVEVPGAGPVDGLVDVGGDAKLVRLPQPRNPQSVVARGVQCGEVCRVDIVAAPRIAGRAQCQFALQHGFARVGVDDVELCGVHRHRPGTAQPVADIGELAGIGQVADLVELDRAARLVCLPGDWNVCQPGGRRLQPVGQAVLQGVRKQQVYTGLGDGRAVVDKAGDLAVKAKAYCRLRFPVGGVLVTLQAEVLRTRGGLLRVEVVQHQGDGPR